MKTLILVAPHFPPSTLAGVHRARHLAKHLPAYGWRPILVSVDSRFYSEKNEPALAELVPAGLRQVRVRALPHRLTRPLGLGDISLRAFFPLRQAIERVTREEGADALMITGSPFYPMILARWAKAELGLPVVLDFQDPWVSSEGAKRPKGSKGWLAHQLALRLEPAAVRNTAFITSVSERQNDEMAARYPWLDRQRMAAIPIGGDPDDFNALRRAPPSNPVFSLNKDKINLSYVGTFMPRSGPLIQVMLHGLSRLRKLSPACAARLQLNFIGTSNQPKGGGLFRVRPLAAEAGVADLVIEEPERVPYLEALSLLANSDGLLLIGSDEPHYTASKIYPALMSGRPYVSLFHQASSAHNFLSRAGGGEALSFADSAELQALEQRAAEALYRLAVRPQDFTPPNSVACEAFHARTIAGRFAEVFDSVTR